MLIQIHTQSLNDTRCHRGGCNRVPKRDYSTQITRSNSAGSGMFSLKIAPAHQHGFMSMWLPGLRTFLGPNRPLSKNSLRCGCCTISWSFGKSHHRIQHIPFAVQSTWSKKAKRPSGAEKTPKRSWSRFPGIQCPAYAIWRSLRRCSTASPE
jgi:hypothetical protein